MNLQNSFCHRLSLLIVIMFLSSVAFGQIDSLRPDSSKQDLKMIVQQKDTTLLIPVDSLSEKFIENKVSKSSYKPKRAWWYSAILPGMGQVYNGKAWKVPIIYTVFLGAFYMIDDNNFKYQVFKDAYKNYATDGPPVWQPEISEAQLKDRKNYFRRNRDLSIIVGGLMYLMNILDASVDANLMDFDISDDISMSVQPGIEPLKTQPQNTFGLKFVLTLNK